MARQLKERLQQISRRWIEDGLPVRDEIMASATALEEWKRRRQVQGLWPVPPLMITSTLDDGLGQGLALIERFAAIMGITVDKMGLLQKPQDIVSRCRSQKPDFLGLTVLQLDSDDDLAWIGNNLPAETCLIAGGAAFRLDPDLAHRCRVEFVAKDVAHFIDFMVSQASFVHSKTFMVVEPPPGHRSIRPDHP